MLVDEQWIHGGEEELPARLQVVAKREQHLFIKVIILVIAETGIPIDADVVLLWTEECLRITQHKFGVGRSEMFLRIFYIRRGDVDARDLQPRFIQFMRQVALAAALVKNFHPRKQLSYLLHEVHCLCCLLVEHHLCKVALKEVYPPFVVLARFHRFSSLVFDSYNK